MKSKTSLFDRTIIVTMLRRYWVGFAAYLCIFGAVTLIPLVNALQEQGWYPTDIPNYASLYELMGVAPTSIIYTNFITVAVAAALLFSYLYNPRHTGMMASLPIKRETMYLSVSAAVVIGLVGCNVIALAMCLLVEVLYGQVHLGALGLLLLISVGTILAFYGLAALCCMLTGNILAGPAVYLIFSFVTIGTESLGYELLQNIVYGISRGYTPKTEFLSPIWMIGNSVDFDYNIIRNTAGVTLSYEWTMEGLGVLAIYAAVGLVLLWLGMLLYKNRRMETAGDTISIEILKPVFRFCCTVCGGMVFALFMCELLYQITPTGSAAAVYIAVLLIVGGTLCYFISQMLITKTVNVFRKGWKTIAIYAVCVIAIVAAIETDLFGYERRVPALEDVTEVTIDSFDGSVITFDDPENIAAILALHQSIIDNKDFHEMESGSPEAAAYIGSFDEPAADFNSRSFRFIYTLNDESLVRRRYSINYGPNEIRDMSSDIRVLEALSNTEEGIEERCVVDYPVTADNVQGAWIDYVEAGTYENKHFSDFSPSEMARLYTEAILPDIKDGKLGTLNIIEDKAYAMSKYNCTIAMEVFKEAIVNKYGVTTYEEYKNIVVYPTLESERTLAFLKEYGIEPAVVYDSMLDDGYDYNDLGRYRIDGEALSYYDEHATLDTRSYPPSASDLIGGADGPTEVYVTK